MLVVLCTSSIAGLRPALCVVYGVWNVDTQCAFHVKVIIIMSEAEKYPTYRHSYRQPNKHGDLVGAPTENEFALLRWGPRKFPHPENLKRLAGDLMYGPGPNWEVNRDNSFSLHGVGGRTASLQEVVAFMETKHGLVFDGLLPIPPPPIQQPTTIARTASWRQQLSLLLQMRPLQLPGKGRG